jgi:hypothetical protein
MWIGALSAIVLSLVIPLVAAAVGVRAVDARIVRWSDFRAARFIFAVAGLLTIHCGVG